MKWHDQPLTRGMWLATCLVIGLLLCVFVAPTDAQAKEMAAPYLEQLYGRRQQLWERPEIREMAEARVTERSFAYSTHGKRAMPVGATKDDPLTRAANHAILGSPDTVIRRIQEDQAAMGSGLQVTSLPFGPMPPSVAMQSLELNLKLLLFQFYLFALPPLLLQFLVQIFKLVFVLAFGAAHLLVAMKHPAGGQSFQIRAPIPVRATEARRQVLKLRHD